MCPAVFLLPVSPHITLTEYLSSRVFAYLASHRIDRISACLSRRPEISPSVFWPVSPQLPAVSIANHQTFRHWPRVSPPKTCWQPGVA
ncbi:hypothetical protein EDB81DRAFT_438224 [Dactylonectria macrodidyma]|uniref:Uncharacterized protein n=1 Tax=Dactylonectria macrodidyma TaxID=307937 RepID=A0A9P9J6F8_9HYPO|nr:hypothetical protein EDB81DRAFT_438224 [Dactylonectria macrodidyma]